MLTSKKINDILTLHATACMDIAFISKYKKQALMKAYKHRGLYFRYICNRLHKGGESVANIKEVAREAGVSTSTVSRTINDSPSISSATKKKVWAAIKKLDYTPNNIAKALTTNKSYTITLLVDVDDEKSFQNPYFYEVIYGIEKYCQKMGFSLMVSHVDTRHRNQDIVDWLVKTKRTEGIIMPVSILNTMRSKQLKEMGVPFVALGEAFSVKESISWVDINNKKGAEKAVYALADRGKKKIAFIGWDKNKDFSNRRLEGYQAAVHDLGLVNDESYIIPCGNTKDEGYDAMKSLMTGSEVPDGVLCANDNLSVGVIKALKESDKDIPDDVAIISFDSRQVATLLSPEITTVDVDVFEMGYQSAKMLFELIDNDDSKDQGLLISTTIVERSTT